MNLRLRLAYFLLHLGDFIKSLPVLVMRPDDLVEFSRRTYAKPQNVESWAEQDLVDSGLSEDEQDLLDALPVKTGELLLLGVGGGREAIPLARAGFHVTGVDYVAALVERSIENAARRGVVIDGVVQEISQLAVPAGAFDVVWISQAMYSCVPTRARRVEMVRRVAQSLKPGGFFVCQYHRGEPEQASAKYHFLRRLIAACTFGNLAYEVGDVLWGSAEFIHIFTSEEALRSELEMGGLTVLEIKKGRSPRRGGAICQKKVANGNINLNFGDQR